jgi:hypothetical protein
VMTVWFLVLALLQRLPHIVRYPDILAAQSSPHGGAAGDSCGRCPAVRQHFLPGWHGGDGWSMTGSARLVGGDRWCLVYPVPPGKCRPVAAIAAETDPWTRDMRNHGVAVRNEELPLALEEVVTVIGQVRGKTLGYAARTGRQPALEKRCFAWFRFTPGAGQLRALDDVASTDEATVGLIRLRSDEIDSVVHPVGEVAVDVACRSEHGFVPIGLSTVGMRPWVAFAGVCFDLGNPDGDGSVGIRALKDAAKKLRCNVEHVAGEERPIRRMETGENTHGTTLPVGCAAEEWRNSPGAARAQAY